MDEANSRVWTVIPEPIPRWQWAVLRRLPSGERRLLARAERALVVYAGLRKLVLVTAPVGYAQVHDGRVFLWAEAWSVAPDGAVDTVDEPVPDVVDQPRCPRCRSLRVQLVWPAMTSWDCDGWSCMACGNNWPGKVGL